MPGERQPFPRSTRAVLTTYEQLQLLFGVRAYHVQGSSTNEAILPHSDFVTVCYEVTVLPEGAWWLPTSTVADPRWNGAIGLQATGSIPTLNVLRPVDLYLWIPRQSLESVFQPLTIAGAVVGDLPASPPPSGTTGP